MLHKQTLELRDDPLTDFDAVSIAEGFAEADPDTTMRAWQHLVDTGLVWKLQGWFGRTANDLLQRGLLRKAEDRPTEDTLHHTL
jgi:hypothetical protein